MSSELIVRFNPQQEWRIDLSRLEPMGMEEARRWLDAGIVRRYIGLDIAEDWLREVLRRPVVETLRRAAE